MTCTFVQITDHHLREAEDDLTCGYSTAYAFRVVLEHMAGHVIDDIDFLVSTGDAVDVPSDDGYQHVCRLLDARSGADGAPGHRIVSVGHRRDVPMVFLAGNHDDRDRFFRWLVPQTSPRPLHNFAFEHGGVRFIGLDWGAPAKAFGHPEMFRFLRESLAADVPSVLLLHHHVVPSGIPWVDDFIAENVHELWPILRGRPVLGIFCGHAHCTYETTVGDVPVFGLRSTAPQFVPQETPLYCIQPLHYRWVRIEDGVLTTRIFEVPL